MTDALPAAVERAFDRHDALEQDGDGFVVTTTVFRGRVTAVGRADSPVYAVTIQAPTIQAATTGDVDEAVADGWFDTLCRRLEDAPTATRADIDLETFTVERDGEEVYATYGFEWDSPSRVADIAKTFVEYVEGTYVEGVVPGYEYEPPVADLLDSASQGGGGGTPL